MWFAKTCKFLCLQKVSFLLNFFFFLHLLSLYHPNAILENKTDTIIIRNNEENEEIHWDLNKFKRQPNISEILTTSTSIPKTTELPKFERIQFESIPIIYVITPTAHRTARKADFIRLAQTIRQVPNLHWIVVEDAQEPCPCVNNILQRLIKNYTYLTAPTPDFKSLGLERNLNKGVFQRNVGLEWIRWAHKSSNDLSGPGVIYFADDDNTYDLRLFEIMRKVGTAAVWPVALVGGVKLEKPRANSTTGKLAGFEVGFAPNRTYAVDMAGFALGLEFVLSKRKGHFPLDTVRGWNEPALFDALDMSYEDIEVMGLDVMTPDGLLEPLVWHTKTVDVNLNEEARYQRNYGKKTSDEGWEV